MKITCRGTNRIEPLLEFVDSTVATGVDPDDLSLRVWEGTTETGMPIHLMVLAVSPGVPRNDPRYELCKAEISEDMRQFEILKTRVVPH